MSSSSYAICFPRFPAKADIPCDLKILKVEEVGSEESIAKFMDSVDEIKKITDVKESV
jgi:hypothetical protein